MKLSVFSSWACRIASGAAALLLIKKIFFQREKESIECLLFSPRDAHVSRAALRCNKSTCPLCNFNELCALLRTAKFQLDVCMYLITEPELTTIVVALHRKGVNVRLITDKQMTEDALKCKSGLFVKYNVPMKCVEAKGMMHNKFFIIDQKVLVTGSPNWTQHGFTSNYENLIIVKSKKVCEMYNNYFNNLWLADKSIQPLLPYS